MGLIKLPEKKKWKIEQAVIELETVNEASWVRLVPEIDYLGGSYCLRLHK